MRLGREAEGTSGCAGASDAQIAGYIADMCAGMLQLVARPSFLTLRYLLDMARAEAELQAKTLPQIGR